MAPRVIENIEALRPLVGSSLGRSRYVTVSQEMIDTFAELTGDRQWIHVDAEAAAAGPFGSRVAHGYLTLSLGPMLAPDVFEFKDIVFGVNYGADRLRFPAPLLAGSEICLEITLTKLLDVDGGIRIYMEYVFRARGATKPCCVAEVIVQYFTPG